jgi:hypothetical protein
MDVTEKLIGGRTFSIRRCSATNALDLELSLAKVGASELVNFDWDVLKGLGGDNTATMLAVGTQIGGLIGGIAQKLSLTELKRLMTIVFNHTDCDGRTIGDKIDETFADRPADIWQAFIAALDHNLRPFGRALLKSSPDASSARASQ